MNIDMQKLKVAALAVREGSSLQGPEAHDSMVEFEGLATPDAVLTLVAEIERLSGLRPEWPPRPPEGDGLPRYGLRWNGPQQPLAVPMADGYWTPWHLADQLKAENDVLRKDAERFRFWRACWGRDEDLRAPSSVEAEMDADLDMELDDAFDAVMAKEQSHDR